MSARPALPRAPGRIAVLGAWITLLVATCAGCPNPSTPDRLETLRSPDGTRPNVLLISVDTLRANHLGAYGYALPTSPAVDALAGDGVLFENAFTPVPTTAPALASLITGRHVDTHLVNANLGLLRGELHTLAESFAAAGYSTAGFYGNGAIQNGFGQGFDRFAPFSDEPFVSDDAGVARAREWLSTIEGPWFLWIHFMDPHGPYNSWPADTSAHLEYPPAPSLTRELEVADRNVTFGGIPKYQRLRGLTRVGDYVRRYDGEIIGTDRQVAALRALVRERSDSDQTLVVFTADHGESLGEDSYYFQHGQRLNDPSLRVPLILSHHSALPRGRRVDTPASLLDVFPTLARLAALDAPEGLEGVDLTPALNGQPLPERTLISYTVTPNHLIGASIGARKLVGIPQRGVAWPPPMVRYFLYDTSVAGDRASAAAHTEPDFDPLRAAVEDAARKLGPGFLEQPKYSPAQIERLRALGYVE